MRQLSLKGLKLVKYTEYEYLDTRPKYIPKILIFFGDTFLELSKLTVSEIGCILFPLPQPHILRMYLIHFSLL